jgi:hypothetical protein
MNNTKLPSILILGGGRHGKDTMAELIVKYYPELTFTSSSWAIAKLIYEDIGQSLYNDVKSCFEDRINNRDTWYNWVCAYNTPDKSRLTKEILNKSSIYVGMRDSEEYSASRCLFDFVLYINASPRISYVDPTFKIPKDKSMIFIDNTKDLEHLSQQAKIFVEIAKGKANLIKVYK